MLGPIFTKFTFFFFLEFINDQVHLFLGFQVSYLTFQAILSYLLYLSQLVNLAQVEKSKKVQKSSKKSQEKCEVADTI